MVKEISLAGPVDPFDVYCKLVEGYHEPVEEIIRTKLHYLLTTPENAVLVGKVTAEILALSVEKLQRLIPGAEIFWDDRVDMPRVFETYPCVIVDVVDGARNLQGGGTDVTSTLAIVDDQKNIPLAVISYPFGVERVADFDGDVYRIPNAIMKHRTTLVRERIEDYRLRPRKEKRTIPAVRLSERYDRFNNVMRQRIDALRSCVRSYTRLSGAISRMMMAVIMESCDVFLTLREEPIDFYDYLAPAKIIRDLGGCVTDLQGNDVPPDALQVEGLIVASRRRTHTTFLRALEL